MKYILAFLVFALSFNSASSAEFGEDVKWLALNIYHEARGESEEGQLAVGHVTLNRVASSKFPDTIKEVVTQKNQFSWYWDGKSDKPKDLKAWRTAVDHAFYLLSNPFVHDPSDGATFYHTKSVDPYWNKHFTQVAVVGYHVFYDYDR